MATKTTKRKPLKSKRKPDLVFTAVFEDGVLRPLSKVRLPKRKELTVIIRQEKRSIADQLRGLFKPKDQKLADEIIASEDWL